MVNVRFVLPVLLLAVLACSAVHPMTIGEAKSYSDGASVFVHGVITYITPTECYIQSLNRSAGIWAEADTTGLVLGNEIYLTGDITIENGERVIRRSYITRIGLPPAVGPLAMGNKSLGGAMLGLQPGLDDRCPIRIPAGNGWINDWQWSSATGPNNIGLLVKTWGTVNSVYQSAVNGVKWFHIDDGSHVASDLGDRGVLVYSDAPVKQGDCVAVTGISSLEPCIDNPGKMVRVLRTRSASDVQVTKPAEAWNPVFSDEFNEPVLNKRWAYEKRCGSVSVASNPGWLRLVMPENGKNGPSVVLRTDSEFSANKTISMRIRAEFSASASAYQTVAVYTTTKPGALVGDTNPRPSTIAGMVINPDMGRLAFTNYYNTLLVGDTIDVTITNGQVTVSYPGIQKPLGGSLEGGGPFLVIAIFSTNPYPTGRPFAAYIDYFRVTSN